MSTYYGISGEYAWQFTHTLTRPLERGAFTRYPRLIRESDRVWKQGPRGGVKLVKVKDHFWNQWPHYIKHDSEEMKQFVWVKLRAKLLNIAL
jgi:hypothetical protein